MARLARRVAMVTTPTKPTVSVNATLDYNGTPIPITSGDVADITKNGFVFDLPDPVTLGTPGEFLTWLHTKFGLPDLGQDITDLANAIPSSPDFLEKIKTMVQSFTNETLNAQITLVTLHINTTSKPYSYSIGGTLTYEPPLSLFGGLSLDSVGVQVTKEDTSS
jgi:hypothetical protein